MGLLPTGYDAEKASSSNSSSLFIKIQPGENKFRILGLRLIFQTWSEDGKPIRYRAIADGKMQRPKHLPWHGRAEGKFGDEKWKHVWMALVWSYADGDLKILELTQSTVQKQLSALDNDEDWGALDSYDVKIVRSGEKMETEYSVIGVPPKPVNKAILEAKAEANLDLDAIVYGAYPNDPEWSAKAWEKMLDNLDKASLEASRRGIELEIPSTGDLAVLQTAYEKAMDLMPLQKIKTVDEPVKETDPVPVDDLAGVF